MKRLCVLALLFGLLSSCGAKNLISNIIVLMMENRSFDHLLGWLKLDYSSKIDGLDSGKSVARDPSNPSAGSVEITRGGYDVSPDDPAHGFDDIAIQINGNRMDGFVYDSILYGKDETNPVSMFDSVSAPIINTLAKEFAVFDKWFCSIPGPTDPNRAFAMSGTSAGVITNFNGTLWTQQSYFDYLRSHNHTFAGYYQDDLWALGYFEDTNKPENSVFIKDLETNFFNDVASGNLPEFTWLQPRSGMHGTPSHPRPPTWQHPDASVIEGEQLIKSVYEAIRAGPKWNETLFIITYDEHGGFYDHVAPPNEGVPAPDANVAPNGFDFKQLGVRIPTLAISPWIPAGTIVSEALTNEQPTPSSAFDSTSIMATTNILLGLADAGTPPLSERMQWANTFAGLVDMLEVPRDDCPQVLPALPSSSSITYEKQRAKPLNEHIEGQLLFYCARNHASAHSKGECPGRPSAMSSQGEAADWIAVESRIYREKLLAAEKIHASASI
jgi:phospholipase C